MSPSIYQKESLCDAIVMAANSGALNYYLKQPDVIYAGRVFFKTHVKDSVFEISRSGSGWHFAYIRSIKVSSAPGTEKYSDGLSDEVLEDKESIAIYNIEGNDVVVTNMISAEMNKEVFLLHSGELNKLCNINAIAADFDRKENSLKCRNLQDRLRGAREFRVKGVEKEEHQRWRNLPVEYFIRKWRAIVARRKLRCKRKLGCIRKALRLQSF
jgi:hypothetical protein